MPPSDKKIRVVLVEDHEVVRVALRLLLDRTGDVETVEEAGTAADALAAVRATRPDVVVLDFKLPDRSGADLCRDLRARSPHTKVLLLTAVLEEDALLGAVLGGADGYLFKTTSPEQLVEAIRTVAAGNPYLGSETSRSVMGLLRARMGRTPQLGTALSSQELRVVTLVAEGKTNKEIAVILGLSDKTVKNYLSHAYEKLQVSNRAEATAALYRMRAR